MTKQDHNEIMRELGAIRSDIKTINDHLNDLNGKVARNVQEIQDLREDSAAAEVRRENYEEWQQNRSDATSKIIWSIGSVLGTVILLAILSALSDVNIISALM